LVETNYTSAGLWGLFKSNPRNNQKCQRRFSQGEVIHSLDILVNKMMDGRTDEENNFN
jgi:hypothetical protein